MFFLLYKRIYTYFDALVLVSKLIFLIEINICILTVYFTETPVFYSYVQYMADETRKALKNAYFFPVQ